jgi:hypothetical protein
MDPPRWVSRDSSSSRATVAAISKKHAANGLPALAPAPAGIGSNPILWTCASVTDVRSGNSMSTETTAHLARGLTFE